MTRDQFSNSALSVIASGAKQSSATHTTLDCFALLAMTWRGQEFPFPRRVSPEFCIMIALIQSRGRREDRVTAAPRALAPTKVAQRARDHRYRRRHSGLPRAVVYGLYELSSVNLSDCHRRGSRCDEHRGLLDTRLWGARTTRFRRPQSMPLVSQHDHVHRIPLHVRDDAYAPLIGSGTETAEHAFRKYETGIFFCTKLDDPNQLERQGKNGLFAPAKLRVKCLSSNPKSTIPCTTGKSEGLFVNPRLREWRPGVILAAIDCLSRMMRPFWFAHRSCDAANFLIVPQFRS